MRDILLVTVDSLRADHLGCFGYERATSPVLDEFAAGGRRFTNAYAHACSTRPSFPAIMTSSYPLAHGGFERLSQARTTLAETLADAGYRTAGFHSNLYLSADFGYDRGFDRFDDSKSDPSAVARLRQFVKTHLDQESALYGLLQTAFDATERRAGVELGSAYVPADELTDMALEWVRQTADGPRFLWVHYMDVHHPYTPPAEHQRRFRDSAVPDERAVRLRRKMLDSPAELTAEEGATIVDLYDAEISFVDTAVGRLLDEVREAWGPETVVAVTADHGEELGDHGRYSHAATFYDEVLHVPLILRDGTSSGTSDALVGLLDVAPTLVDLAGETVPDDFVGTSLDGSGPHDRDQVVAEWADYETDERRFALRTLSWKYVRMADGTERLFDLDTDPAETSNVAGEYPDTCARFRERIQAHANRVDSESVGAAMDAQVRARLRDLGYQE